MWRAGSYRIYRHGSFSSTPVARTGQTQPEVHIRDAPQYQHTQQKKVKESTNTYRSVAYNPRLVLEPVRRAARSGAVMERIAADVSAGVGANRHGHSLYEAHGAAPPLSTPAGGKTRPLWVRVCLFTCVCMCVFWRGITNSLKPSICRGIVRILEILR